MHWRRSVVVRGRRRQQSVRPEVLVEYMPHVSYDPVGFAVPLVAAVLYLPRALKLVRGIDWVLFASMTLMTAWAGYCDELGGHLPAVYGFALMYYLCLPVVSRAEVHKPAAMLLPFLFASMALPDIYLAYRQGCSDSVTVGGNGWRDGLMLRSVAGFVGYGMTACLAKFSADWRRGIRMSWRRELVRHFATGAGRAG